MTTAGWSAGESLAGASSEPGRMAAPPPNGRSLTNRQRSIATRLGVLALVLIIAYLVVQPLFRLQSLAFEDGARAYSAAVDVAGISDVLWTTLRLAVGSVVIAVTLGTTLAWMAMRLPRRWQWLSSIPVLPIVIPAVASVTGWAFLLSPATGYVNALLRRLPFIDDTTGPIDVFTEQWIIIIVGFSLTSFVYLFVRAGLRNLDQELLEAAQTSGLSSTAAFFRIALPILRPTLVYGASTALLLGLGQVTAPLLLGTRTGVRVLTTEVYRSVALTPADYGLAAALASPLLLAGIAVVLLQRLLLGNQARFVSRSGKSSRLSIRPSRLAAPILGLYGIVAILLPLTALVIVSLSPFWSGDIAPSTFTLRHFREIFENEAVVDSIWNSVTISLVSVLIALPLGFLIASVVVRSRRSFLRGTLDFLVNIPIGVPAVIFGVGMLYTYTRPPLVLYGTPWVIVIVYVTLSLPFTTRFQLSGLIALGPHYEEAARVSGRGLVMTKLGIVVPLMRTSLGGAAAIMIVLLTHEFSASVLVRSVDTQVMGTQLFDLWTFGSYPQVAALAIVMCVITALGVLLAMVLAGRDVVETM